MSQLRSMSRWILPGAGLVTCLLFGSCGATPVPNGSGEGTGGTRGGSSMLGGTSGTSTGGTITNPGTTPTETNNCGSQKHQTAQGKADVLLVLDMSGSMARDAVGGGTRIANLTTALNQVLPPTDSKINWGLMVYPAVTSAGRRGTTGQIMVSSGCDPGTVLVAVGENNAANVKEFYSKLTPPESGGYTPTAKSIANAAAALQQRSSGNPKYIVLATDGLPNCPNSRLSNTSDAPAAVAAVTAAAQAGIPVFVVGMSITGSDADEARDALNKMAVAGGRPASDGEIKYYAADTADQLVTAMNAIGGQIASCNFALPAGAPPVPTNVLVVYDDHRALPSAGTWGYTDATNTSITIFGEDCEKVMNGTYKNVQILYGCPGEAQLIP